MKAGEAGVFHPGAGFLYDSPHQIYDLTWIRVGVRYDPTRP